jgi:hypothetical protein
MGVVFTDPNVEMEDPGPGMFPKAPCVKSLVPSVALVGNSGTCKRWAYWEVFRSLGAYPPKGIVGPWSFPPFLFAPWP